MRRHSRAEDAAIEDGSVGLVRPSRSGSPLQAIDEFFSTEHRYSLGLDADSGRHYLSIPVSASFYDYEEYYALGDDEYARLLADPAAAAAFADECRRRQHDELLIIEPGPNRGAAG